MSTVTKIISTQLEVYALSSYTVEKISEQLNCTNPSLHIPRVSEKDKKKFELTTDYYGNYISGRWVGN